MKFGFDTTKEFDKIICTEVVPAIAKAYGTLECERRYESADEKNALLIGVTRHLMKIIKDEAVYYTSKCMCYNQKDKLDDKQFTDLINEFSKSQISYDDVFMDLIQKYV